MQTVARDRKVTNVSVMWKNILSFVFRTDLTIQTVVAEQEFFNTPVLNDA